MQMLDEMRNGAVTFADPEGMKRNLLVLRKKMIFVTTRQRQPMIGADKVTI